MISLIGGVIALVVGFVLIIAWGGSFLEVVKGTLPLLCIMGGALAAYLGYEEIKDKSASESNDNENADLKNEVESLKEELRELKGEKPNTSDGATE